MDMTKEQVIKELNEMYESLSKDYDANGDKMAEYFDRIEGLKVINKGIHEKMRKVVDMIKKAEGK